ncbi:MAG: glutamate--tRNA ligase [Clostridiaceae bacterium]|jgi:glutamyl-tRNA synthetase|nr:glutamate--tRNA ligase [Clostridiaceae bacterium]
MERQVRTRFAPSPTGYMHIGNLRTALYEYLVAKSKNGKFILRIEDTDQERLVEGAVDVIYNTLKLCGMNHDEGPDIGGPYEPYVQSERKNTYKPYAEELIEKGHAYYCFCSKERLDSLRSECEAKNQTFMYDRHCLSLSKEEIAEKLKNGEPCVIRQKMPREGTTTFEDTVYGSITIENNMLEDQILLKSDGLPTYNFANVIDDHLMDITHVVRGSEYLSSTPKYNLLYEAFGWDIPVYIHLPLIVKPDGSKISKRKGDAGFEDLLKMGYLVEAIINYIALLGWSPDSNQEMFTLSELEKAFDISNISKSPSSFDMDKLKWFNAQYIRAKSPEEFHELALPYLADSITNKDIDLSKVSKILQARTEVLTDIPSKVGFLNELCDYDLNIYVHKKMKTTFENSLESLKAALPVLENLESWNETSIHDNLLALVEQLGIKNGQMLWPVRTAISGWAVTPGGAIEIADILGKNETLRRIKIGIERLEKAIAVPDNN